MADPLLSVQNLSTSFFTSEGVVQAVNDVSYDLMPGQTLGLVGESGSGKSVSALSLLRLIPNPPGKIVNGEVWFDGEELMSVDDSRMREIRGNDIAMVFQEPMTSLNPVLTIGFQLTEALKLHLDMSNQEAWDRAAELLRLVGIPDSERRLKDYPHQFSGGMRQRVMIALAVSCNPRLIIADEPTTALDVTIQAQVLEVMRDLAEQFGTALVIITHNLGVVARYAERVIVMYAGRIIESGSAEEVYHDPKHPYTLGLLKSVPRLDEDRPEKLEAIEGLPPLVIDLPDACAFAPRCPYAIDKCSEAMPELEEISPSHWSRCYRSGEIEALAGA